MQQLAQSVRAALKDAVYRGRTRLPVEVRQASFGPSTVPPAGLAVEELEYQADSGKHGWVPLRIVRPTAADRGLPAIIFLHGTGGSKDSMRARQEGAARRGYFTAAIDCCYHGDRSQVAGRQDKLLAYQEALVRAWRGGPERPFLLDNVWDLLALLDLLEGRPEVDARRIGMTGVSLGGMHTWLTAVLDDRVAVAAPMIGVQGFKWAVENDQWQARVSTIQQVFTAAAQDLGKPEPDAAVVAAVWNKIMPGLLEAYDAPLSLPTLAPRPLLIANGELDPRCPIPGLQPAFEAARAAYEAAGVPDRVALFIEKDLPHRDSPVLQAEIDKWLDRFLLPQQSEPEP